MRGFGSVVLPVLVALLTSLATNRVIRPTVTLSFEPNYPMRIPSEQRPLYGDQAFAIEIKSDVTLKAAIVRLVAISEKPDLSNPINGFVEPAFGWPLGGDSFQPRTIGGTDYILIASNRKDALGGNHLMLFFNEFIGSPGPENHPLPELEPLRDLSPGTYWMKIVLLSESVAPTEGKFKLEFDRSTDVKLSAVK